MKFSLTLRYIAVDDNLIMCVKVLNIRNLCEKHPHKFADAEFLCKHTHTHTHTQSFYKKSSLKSIDYPVITPCDHSACRRSVVCCVH